MNDGHGLYSKERVFVIVLIAVILAVIAWAIGFSRAALGVLAGLPVALLNHFLMVRAWKKTQPPAEEADGTTDEPEADEESTEEASKSPSSSMSSAAQMQVFGWSLVRMVISGTALLVAIRLGPEFVIGMLVGLLSEMVTYIGDTVRMIMVRSVK